MDRNAFVACALLLAPVLLGAGCGVQQAAEPAATAPRVLAELQECAPGPWRRDDRMAVAPTSLECPVKESYAPSVLDPDQIGELRSRMNPPGEQAPYEAESVEPAVPQATAPDGSADARLPDAGAAHRAPAPAPTATSETGMFPMLVDPTPAPAQAPLASEPRMLEDMAPPVASSSERLPSTIPPLPEQRGSVPWAASTSSSPEMRAVHEQAEQRLRQGFQLAERGAAYLARAEFLAVLELIAQASDLQRDTQFHTGSLTAGLAALEESRDFVRQRPVGKQLDIERVVSGHRTPIFKDQDLDSISPLLAARRYYTYAQEQLAGAAAGEACSSIALYGLGRIATATGEASPAQRLEATAQAMVWHQAALMADRANFRAANELGVLLARNGDLVHSRNLLVHSVRLSPHPSTFRNLAVVHTNLGETQLAEQAMNQGLALERAGHRRQGPAVQWVDPVTFAGSAPTTDSPLPPVAKAPAAPAADAKEAPVSTARKNSWLPWSTRR